jgi:hypothetical protein
MKAGPATAGIHFDDECALAALRCLFAGSGLVEIETTVFDIVVQFADFAAFWTAQTPNFSPTTRLIAGLDDAQRARLIECLHDELSARPDGRIAYLGRANTGRRALPLDEPLTGLTVPHLVLIVRAASGDHKGFGLRRTPLLHDRVAGHLCDRPDSKSASARVGTARASPMRSAVLGRRSSGSNIGCIISSSMAKVRSGDRGSPC